MITWDVGGALGPVLGDLKVMPPQRLLGELQEVLSRIRISPMLSERSGGCCLSLFSTPSLQPISALQMEQKRSGPLWQPPAWLWKPGTQAHALTLPRGQNGGLRGSVFAQVKSIRLIFYIKFMFLIV